MKNNTQNFKKIAQKLFNFPRSYKIAIAISIDILCCILSVRFSYFLRLGEFVPISEKELLALFLSVLLTIPIFIYFGLYKAIIRYSGSFAILTVLKASSIYGLLYAHLITGYGIPNIPRTIGLIQPLVFCRTYLTRFPRLLIVFLFYYISKG